jgi:hypothetical protein
MDMTPQSYKCWLVAWAKTALDAWHLSIDVRTAVVNAFHEQGIKAHMRHYAAHSPHEDVAAPDADAPASPSAPKEHE